MDWEKKGIKGSRVQRFKWLFFGDIISVLKVFQSFGGYPFFTLKGISNGTRNFGEECICISRSKFDREPYPYT